MKHCLTLLLIAIGSTSAFSQSVITRISGGETYFYYSTLNSASFIQNVITDAEHGDTIISVSYTHLDVYKRQALVCSDCVPPKVAAIASIVVRMTLL